MPSPLPPSGEPAPATVSGLPYPYYFVGKDGSFGYRALETAEEGVPDAQFLPGFGVATPRTANKPQTTDPFGLTTHGLWLPLRDLNGPVTPPGPLVADLDQGEVAWIVGERAPVFASPGGQRRRNERLEPLSRVQVLERTEHGRESWLRIGEAAWIRARGTTSPRPGPVPPEARPGERWIDVDLDRQVVTAYQGERAIFAMPASTGRGAPGSELATPAGAHRLWIKLATSDMDNLENLEASETYAIQAVPWVMYFERGYGLHGAFWHRAFGRVQSHGCVNLTPKDAERLFAWTSPRLPPGWSAVFPTDYEAGTIVRVR
jgi:lipoprotein-anchoring transpeptidase ErfK/SrfK